ncbi:MAG TPA: iron-containing alcohol dehydrogenase [Thermoprotei archaeon]|nr:iron-containing alcohol dehydrogenase [Thermoprotei archaeon]
MPGIYLPKIIFEGFDALDSFIEYLRDEDVKKIFIVTDEKLYEIGLHKILTDELKDFNYTIYKDVKPEPTVDSVYKLGEAVREYKPDIIIALGGGSVIDAAKGGWILYEAPDFNIEDISPLIKIGVGRKAKLVSIPTTSGTGSEATLAVVYTRVEDGRKIKIPLGSYELVSTIVVLDPRFVVNLPKDLTLYTALDALSHAVESYVSNTSNPYTDALAEASIVNIFRYLPKLMEDLGNIELRRIIHVSADMAGIAFSNSGLGIAHGIAHIVGGRYNIHHGKSVGIVLPYAVKANYESDEARSKYEHISMRLYREGLSTKDPLYIQIYNFIKELGGSIKYSDYVSEDIFKSDLDDLISLILQDPDLIYNPIPPDYELVKKVLLDSYYGWSSEASLP